MKRPKIKEVIKDMHDLDMGCVWLGYTGKLPDNKIAFDADIRGNGNGPYLILKLYKEYARFLSGTDLSKKEKGIKYHYKNFTCISDFSYKISTFTNRYFSSFEKTPRRMVY